MNYKSYFPIFNNTPNLVYFDSASTTQKPDSVIKTLTKFYSEYNSNVGKGVYKIAYQATNACEEARIKIQKFINAENPEEIIFTAGATDSINIVANGMEAMLNDGDDIIISIMEHHSNIIPWQILAKKKKLNLKVIPLTNNFEIDLAEYKKLLSTKTKLVAITSSSNVLGTIVPIKKIVELAHRVKAVVLVDGAQTIAHTEVDVQKINCDFFVFSGHKMYGPTGIGILYGKKELLNEITPNRYGGGMVTDVNIKDTIFDELPQKLEAGTKNISGTIGLGAAIDFLLNVKLENIKKHEAQLFEILSDGLKKSPNVTLYGNMTDNIGLISFTIDNVHPHDAGSILDYDNIAVRVGNHCAQPLIDYLKTQGTIRVSLGLYNTEEDIEKLLAGIKRVNKIFHENQ